MAVEGREEARDVVQDRFVRVQDQDPRAVEEEAGDRRLASLVKVALEDRSAPEQQPEPVPQLEPMSHPRQEQEHHQAPPMTAKPALAPAPEQQPAPLPQPQEQQGHQQALPAATTVAHHQERSVEPAQQPDQESRSVPEDPESSAAKPMAEQFFVEEVSKWDEKKVARYLQQELQHAKEKIHDIIVFNEVFGLFFLKQEWQKLGASQGLAKAFCHFVAHAKEQDVSPKSPFDRIWTQQPASLGSRKVTALSSQGLDTDVQIRKRTSLEPAAQEKRFKHLSSKSIPTVEEIFVNYGTDGVGFVARTLREIGHTPQWYQLLQINRRIKKEIKENFPMFTKVCFRQKNGHWNTLQQKIASNLVNGELEPVVSQPTCQRSQNKSSLQPTVQQPDGRPGSVCCQPANERRNDGVPHSTLGGPYKHYDDRLFPGGRGQVMRRRTSAAGYSMLTVKIVSIVRADLVVPHSRIHLNELDEGRQLEWLKCLTTTDNDPSVHELDSKEDEEEHHQSGHVAEQQKRKRCTDGMLAAEDK